MTGLNSFTANCSRNYQATWNECVSTANAKP
jgi:hypothetical protein